MDLLKRELAPIAAEGWQVIDRISKDLLINFLSARQIVDVDGPHGWETNSVGRGRLDGNHRVEGLALEYGVRTVHPLVEFRAFFELDIWEIDNIVRGCLDPDLRSLEEAARIAADFEDTAVFKGFNSAGIYGLGGTGEHGPISVSIPLQAHDIVRHAAVGISKMKAAGIQGPYAFTAAPEVWEILASNKTGYSAVKQLLDILGGPIVTTAHLEGACLTSVRGGDFVLTLGQDLALGYHSHDHSKVRLFFTESFTFRTLEPRAVLWFRLDKGAETAA